MKKFADTRDYSMNSNIYSFNYGKMCFGCKSWTHSEREWADDASYRFDKRKIKQLCFECFEPHSPELKREYLYCYLISA